MKLEMFLTSKLLLQAQNRNINFEFLSLSKTKKEEICMSTLKRKVYVFSNTFNASVFKHFS